MSKITTVASTVPVVTEGGSADNAKWRFTGGFLAFSVLSGAAFYMTMSVLVPQRLRDIGIANSTAVLGTINAVGSIASIFIALFIGALSDRTQPVGAGARHGSSAARSSTASASGR